MPDSTSSEPGGTANDMEMNGSGEDGGRFDIEQAQNALIADVTTSSESLHEVFIFRGSKIIILSVGIVIFVCLLHLHLQFVQRKLC